MEKKNHIEHFQNLTMYCPKAGPTKLERTGILWTMFTNHNGIKIETSNQRLNKPILNQVERGEE